MKNLRYLHITSINQSYHDAKLNAWMKNQKIMVVGWYTPLIHYMKWEDIYVYIDLLH